MKGSSLQYFKDRSEEAALWTRILCLDKGYICIPIHKVGDYIGMHKVGDYIGMHMHPLSRHKILVHMYFLK